MLSRNYSHLSRLSRSLSPSLTTSTMPKVTVPQLPVSALFGVVKPSGPTSMAVINDVKRLISASRLFVDELSANKNSQVLYSPKGKGLGKDKGKRKRGNNPGRGFEAKVGQGGTLDPLADGVLVVAVNKATKKLQQFLDCVKEYRTTCLLGCETDTYDSEGAQVRAALWRHITREKVEEALEQFRGQIFQTPPVFSALKMDGKPLYEYARSGLPLPRPIERRRVTIHELELVEWIPGTDPRHKWRFPEKKFTEDERRKLEKALKGSEMKEEEMLKDEPEVSVEEGIESGEGVNVPPAFVLRMRVSGGTYVRSIAHDLGHALGSAAHVVTLTRARQGRFCLERSNPEANISSTPSDSLIPSTSEAQVEALLMATEPEYESATEEGTDGEKPEPDGAPSKKKRRIKTPKGPVAVEVREEKSPENPYAALDQKEDRLCVPWEIFTRALEDGGEEKPDADGWREWEREVILRMEVVE